MTFKKFFALSISCLILGTAFISCKKKNEEVSQVESTPNELLNDYRGGIYRSIALENKVLDILNYMKSNNEKIRNTVPNNFWNTEGYQEFVEEFILTDMIDDTDGFNEELTDWDEIVTYMETNPNSFTVMNDDGTYSLKDDAISIEKLAKNEYIIKDITSDFSFGDNVYNGQTTYNCLYDSDKDWLKGTRTVNLTGQTYDNKKIPKATTDLYEYIRIDDNTFAIQTIYERLFILLEPVDDDVPIVDREIKEFYYSRLNKGQRTTFSPFKPLNLGTTPEEYDWEKEEYNNTMLSYPFFNENGDMACSYGCNDSIFLKENIAEEIDENWVFEDKALIQTMVYKEGALVVTTYNKLTERYERFIFTEKGVSDNTVKELEDIVEIEGLVGKVIIPEIAVKTEYNEGYAQQKDEEQSNKTVTDATVTDAVNEETEETSVSSAESTEAISETTVSTD